jgi:hypothetical protein
VPLVLSATLSRANVVLSVSTLDIAEKPRAANAVPASIELVFQASFDAIKSDAKGPTLLPGLSYVVL